MLRGQPVALAAISYMFFTNLDLIFVIPLLPILHGGTAVAIARDVAFALSLRLGAVIVHVTRPAHRGATSGQCCSASNLFADEGRRFSASCCCPFRLICGALPFWQEPAPAR